MKIHIASLTHKHGTNLYGAATREELMDEIADYCRANDHEKEIDPALKGEEVVDAYFSPEIMGQHEWLDVLESEALMDITQMVRTLADVWHVDHVNGDMDELHAKAQALTSMDYEGPARAAGWNWDEGGPCFFRNRPGASLLEPYEYQRIDPIGEERLGDWEQLCDEEGIEPDAAPEIFFAISEEFADELPPTERVEHDFAGMIVWAVLKRAPAS